MVNGGLNVCPIFRGHLKREVMNVGDDFVGMNAW